MASKALKAPLIRCVAIRGYAQVAPVVQRDTKIHSTVLSNQVAVAALDNNSPVSRITVAFRAGSRYEPQTELGISHVVRSAAGLTTKKATSFLIARKLAQLGAVVNACGDREFIYYTLEATQDKLDDALVIFNQLIFNQEFRPWELDDNEPRLKFDISAIPPQVRAVDLLHKAAFRRELGNSLFISPKRIGKISSESLLFFTGNHMLPERCAISVIGASADKASLIAQEFGSSNTKTTDVASKYYGGELRKEMGGELAHIAFGLKGAPANSPQAVAFAIAAKALGNGPSLKWGCDNSTLAKAVGNIGPFAAAGFNVSYSDNGLFGAVISVPKDEAKAAAKGVAGVLQNPTLSAEAIKAAKNRLKLEILSEAEDGTQLAESFAAQLLYTRSVTSPYDLVKLVDQVSANDVIQVFKTAAQSKISMGAAGNLSYLPYVDEL